MSTQKEQGATVHCTCTCVYTSTQEEQAITWSKEATGARRVAGPGLIAPLSAVRSNYSSNSVALYTKLGLGKILLLFRTPGFNY